METSKDVITFVSRAELDRTIVQRELRAELDECEMALARLPDGLPVKNEMYGSIALLGNFLNAPDCDYVALRIFIENTKDTIEAARVQSTYGTRAEQLARAREKAAAAALVADRRASIHLVTHRGELVDSQIDRDVLAARIDELLTLVRDDLVDVEAQSKIVTILADMRRHIFDPRVILLRVQPLLDECQAEYTRLSAGSFRDAQVRAALREQEAQRRRRKNIRVVTSQHQS